MRSYVKLFLVVALVSAYVVWRLERSFESKYADLQAAAHGLFDYESPLPPSWDKISAKSQKRWAKMPDGLIDYREAEQTKLWRALVAKDYLAEEGVTKMCTDNGNMYPNLDRVFLYTFLRHMKPKRMIEIGSGESTVVAVAAFKANDNGAEHTCIEPYRADQVPPGPKVVATEMQDMELSFFDKLESGDVLFIDSSHVAAPYGDTLTELLYVLPRLSTGVLVHVHDIFLPWGYAGIYGGHRNEYIYTEQQALALLLAGSKDWEVVFGARQMVVTQQDELKKMKHYPEQYFNGGSFWIRKLGKPLRSVL
jgi:hypothetical protein